MRTDFNSKEEAIAFSDYFFAINNTNQARQASVSLGSSMEAFLKEVYKKEIGTLTTSTLESIIKDIVNFKKNGVYLIPDNIVNITGGDYNLFDTIRLNRNIIHGKEVPKNKFIKILLKEYEKFISWYTDKYDLLNWLQIWEERKEFYEESIKISLSSNIAEEIKTVIKDQINQSSHNDRLAKLNIKCPLTIEVIGPNYFTDEVVNEDLKNKFTLDFYTRFNNNFSNLKKVIANNIYIRPNDKFFVRQFHEKEANYLHLDEIVSKITFGQPTLIKIMQEGGSGKSTLIWHIIKSLHTKHTICYFHQLDVNAVEYIFEYLLTGREENAVLFFVDELVTQDVNKEHLLLFAQTITKYSTKAAIALFCTERPYRYNRFKNSAKFEDYFSVFDLTFSNEKIQGQIFEKVFNCLCSIEESSIEHTKKACLKEFIKSDNESLIDRIFNLLIFLKKSTIEIRYQFDWEDWKNYNNNVELENLFEIVAFFYRYGISVPLKFRNSDFLSVPKNSSILLDSIEDFKKTTAAPILLSIDSNGKAFLRLRHEKIAEWYFNFSEHSELKQKILFESFIKEVNDEASAYLFRNLTESAEFNKTALSKYLDSKEKIRIIKNYLEAEIPTSEPYGKAVFYLSSLFQKDGDIEAAQNSLLNLISVQPKNVYAYHGLGELYYANGHVLSAEDNFKRSYELDPKSMYSIGSMYKLYDTTNNILELHKLKLKLLELSKQDVKYAFNFLLTIDSVENVYNYELDQLEQLWRDHLPYRSKLSHIYYRKGNFTMASSVLTAILKFVNPHDFLSRSQLATLYLKQAELPRFLRSKNNLLAGAESHLKESISINPENIYSFTELARVYIAKGDLEEALIELEKAFKINAKNIPPRNIYIDILLLRFKKISAHNITERIRVLEEAQLYALETLKLNRFNFQTVIALAKVNYALINILAKVDPSILSLLAPIKKDRNKNAVRLKGLHFYFLNRFLQENKGYLINKHNQACAGLFARHLFEQNKIEEAERILKIILYKFPENHRAAICLIKVYHERNEKEKIFEFLIELRKSHLRARHYLMLVKEMNKSAFFDYIDYFLSYKPTVWEVFDVIEFSVFLYSVGKFEKSYNVLDVCSNNHSFDTVLTIYQERTSEIKDFDLIELTRVARKSNEDLQQVLDNLSYTISILYIFSKKNLLREVGIKILKVLNFKSKSLMKKPHFESLKRIAQAYLKTYDKSFKILQSALEYYQKAYITNGSDIELNKELINTYIELGQYKPECFETAIFTCKELQKKFPIEPLYLYLEAKTLKKINQPDEIYQAIQKFIKAEILVDRNIKIENSFRVIDLKKIADCFRKKAAYNYQVAECSKALLGTIYSEHIHIESMIVKRLINSLNYYYLAIDNIIYKDLRHKERRDINKLKARLIETEEQIADDIVNFYIKKNISKSWLTTAKNIYGSVLKNKAVTQNSSLSQKIEELKQLIK